MNTVTKLANSTFINAIFNAWMQCNVARDVAQTQTLSEILTEMAEAQPNTLTPAELEQAVVENFCSLLQADLQDGITSAIGKIGI